jgi:hypothetical protein
LNDILNTAGLLTIKEAANIFHGKVSATHHDAYLESSSATVTPIDKGLVDLLEHLKKIYLISTRALDISLLKVLQMILATMEMGKM